ncbi:E3 ubiquitin ligase BIG BROTHER-related-like [Magnolia sinica]|uniref:E3 ubiquitin ligase BIG BROTHER-related-like n=1 Tax=Magnolia sinica TaxID=86752 RepID=UPI002658CF23|nr:E3 ubiquitin ligase BIG BROTHER-related-like [Magnolia sinica]
MDGDDHSPAPRVPFTQLDQVDSDFALARALQEQERAILMLTMDRGDGDGDSTDSDSDDEDDLDDDDEDFIVDDGMEDGGQDWQLEDLREEDSDFQEIGEDIDPDELSYEELTALGEVVGSERRGLEMDAIASLPSSTYKFQPMSNESFTQCVICQIDYEEGESLVVLPCKHPYHSECINKWLQINRVCPICGKEVASSTPGKTT